VFEKFPSLAKDAAIYGLGGIIGRLLSIFLVPLYTRLLTPADYGVLDVISTATSLLIPLLILGLEAALPFYYYDTANHQARKTIITTAFFFRIVVSATVCSLLLLTAGTVSNLFFSNVGKEREFIELLQIAIITMPFSVSVLFYQSLLRAQRRPWKFATITLSQLFLVIGLNLYLVAWLKIGVAGVLWSNLVANVVLTFVGLGMIRANFVLTFSFSWLRQLLEYGLPLVPVSIAYWVLVYADRYFLLRYSNLTEIGLYSVGNKLSAALALFSGAFQLAWPPFAFSVMKDPRSNEIYAKVLLLYLTGMMFLATGVSLFAREILLIVTTPAYVGAYTVVGMLCLGLVANGSFYVVGVGLSISKKTQHLAWVTMLAAGLNILLNFILIPPFGMMGAGITTALSFAFSTIVLYRVAQKHYFIPYDVQKIGYVLLIGIVAILAGGVLDRMVQAVSLGLLFGKGTLLLAFPILLVGMKVYGLNEIRRALSVLGSEIFRAPKFRHGNDVS
jgi:O-antigen/teichoic acid export membrane protein